MKKSTLSFFLFIYVLCNPPFLSYSSAQQRFRVVSYNVENLFDTQDNPEKDDNDFLPSGNRFWNNTRLYRKIQQIAKVIIATGGWEAPALVGLCEVENDSVLFRLTHQTALHSLDYRYIITNSPDNRGINVALLYQRDVFRYLKHNSIPIHFKKKKQKKTRDILHVQGKITTGDTLDVFVCHFPSRYGGEKESEQKRLDAAYTLKRACDSIERQRQFPLILIMGDFNDTPKNKSIRRILSAQPLSNNTNSTTDKYFNLFTHTRKKGIQGSHKYHGEWSQLDHIIIHKNLIAPYSPFQLIPESIQIFTPSFLLTTDKTWRGVRPLRTFYGFKYEGGFSDHLPIIADFSTKIPSQSTDKISHNRQFTISNSQNTKEDQIKTENDSPSFF